MLPGYTWFGFAVLPPLSELPSLHRGLQGAREVASGNQLEFVEQEVLIDILEEDEGEDGEARGASPTRVHVSLTAAATDVAVAPELPTQLLGRGGADADADGDGDGEQQPGVGCQVIFTVADARWSVTRTWFLVV